MSVKSDVSVLRSELNSISSHLNSIRSDVASVRSEIAELRSEIRSEQMDQNRRLLLAGMFGSVVFGLGLNSYLKNERKAKAEAIRQPVTPLSR